MRDLGAWRREDEPSFAYERDWQVTIEAVLPGEKTAGALPIRTLDDPLVELTSPMKTW